MANWGIFMDERSLGGRIVDVYVWCEAEMRRTITLCVFHYKKSHNRLKSWLLLLEVFPCSTFMQWGRWSRIYWYSWVKRAILWKSHKVEEDWEDLSWEAVMPIRGVCFVYFETTEDEIRVWSEEKFQENVPQLSNSSNCESLRDDCASFSIEIPESI